MGCEELINPARFPTLLGLYSSGAHDGRQGFFYYSTVLDRRPVDVLMRDDGEVLGAWRQEGVSTGFCRAELRLGPTHAAVILEDGLLTNFPVYYAPIEELGAQAEPLTVLTPELTGGSHGLDHASVSARSLAIEQESSGTITRTSIDGPTVIVARGGPRGAFAVGTDVFFTQTGPGPDFLDRIFVAHEDAAVELLREVPGGWTSLEGADERELVWWEGREPLPNAWNFARLELWRAPFTADPRALRAERVVRVPETIMRPDPRMGFGHFVYLDEAVRDIDLRTGEVFELLSPPDHYWNGVGYSGPDDVLLELRPVRSRDVSRGAWPNWTLLRVRHDAFGPPIPPEGRPFDGSLDYRCPPRVSCASFEGLRGAACSNAGSYCMCTGDDRCLWQCEAGTFEPTSFSCSALGVSTEFP